MRFSSPFPMFIAMGEGLQRVLGMQISYSMDEFKRMAGPSERHAVTIGNFDGVHKGHRELIRVTREKAAERNVPSALVTFDPHPVHVVRAIEKPDLLTPLSRKLELLEATGLDRVLVLPFTRAVAAMSAEDFAREVLVDTLRATDLVTGFNFAMGKGREGNYTALTELGRQFSFAVTQVPPVIVGRETVSSSLVREHIRSGDMEKATTLLGRMHSVDGGIIHGEGRGRKLGFPTANIRFGSELLPPLGAYATWLRILSEEGSEPFPSMTSVGTNPTFGGTSLSLETNVLDFSADLYGKTVRLYFASRLRAEITFKSAADLVARLRHDADAAREALDRGREETIV